MGELKAFALEGSAYSLVSDLEPDLTRIDDLARAAEVMLEAELYRDNPAGEPSRR